MSAGNEIDQLLKQYADSVKTEAKLEDQVMRVWKQIGYCMVLSHIRLCKR